MGDELSVVDCTQTPDRKNNFEKLINHWSFSKDPSVLALLLFCSVDANTSILGECFDVVPYLGILMFLHVTGP